MLHFFKHLLTVNFPIFISIYYYKYFIQFLLRYFFTYTGYSITKVFLYKHPIFIFIIALKGYSYLSSREFKLRYHYNSTYSLIGEKQHTQPHNTHRT